MARTERWMREKFLTESTNIRPTDDSSKYEMMPLRSITPSPTKVRRRKKQEPLFELSNQEYQITEMLEVYATSGNDSGTGRLMLLKWIYDVLLGLYLFFTLWGYVAGKMLVNVMHHDDNRCVLLCIDLLLNLLFA